MRSWAIATADGARPWTAEETGAPCRVRRLQAGRVLQETFCWVNEEIAEVFVSSCLRWNTSNFKGTVDRPLTLFQ
jgi:alpha-mannosidase